MDRTMHTIAAILEMLDISPDKSFVDKFPKQSLTDGVLTVLYKRGLGRFAAPFALPGTILK